MGFKDLTKHIHKVAMSSMGEKIEHFTHDGAGPFNLLAILDEAFQTIDENGNVIISENPMLSFNEKDFEIEPKSEDEFIVNSKSYYADEIQRDGFGGLKILLTEYAK